MCRTVKDSNSSSSSPTTVEGHLGRDSICRGPRSMETVAKAMLGAVVVVADQGQIAQFGGAAVLPVPQMVGVESAGGPAAGHHTAAVPVLQRPA